MRLIKISVYISNLFDYEEMNISDLGHYQSPCSTKDSKNTQFFLMEMNWTFPVCDHFMIDNTVLKPFIMALNWRARLELAFLIIKYLEIKQNLYLSPSSSPQKMKMRVTLSLMKWQVLQKWPRCKGIRLKNCMFSVIIKIYKCNQAI